MKALIEYQSMFSVEDCERNPDKLYVFGDNLQRYGKGGQAVIRDCSNAIGVATKRQPTINNHAYLSGIYWQDTLEALDDISKVFKEYYVKDYDSIVLPRDGLGTGRAKLSENNPRLLQILTGVFYNESTD